jgi:hypothetical protein
VPRDTKTAILHTRYATQGRPSVNENNHPVWSPDQTIALVHNGVIWNDHTLRMSSALEGLDMPEVDTAVLPALLQVQGTDGFARLAGDAAVAWLDNADKNTLHLSRIESSPVAYTNVEDGSFVFASTPTHLRNALSAMQIEHGEVFIMGELDYYQLQGGVIWDASEVPEPIGYRTGVAASTRGATSGGHGTPTTVGSTFLPPRANDEEFDAIAAAWAARDAEVDAALASGVEEFEETVNTDGEDRTIPMFRVGLDKTTERINSRWYGEDEEEVEDLSTAEYYTVDQDGGLETYDTLDELETALLFKAGTMGEGDGLGNEKTKWVNFYMDIEEPSEIRQHEGASDDGLEYIRDGVGIISMLAGR